MSDCFTAPLWRQAVHAALIEEVDPHGQPDLFRARNVGFSGDNHFWQTPSPEPQLSASLIEQLSVPLAADDPLVLAAAQLAGQLRQYGEPAELVLVAILRAGVPIADWLSRLLPEAIVVATSLFVGHGIDQVSLENIRGKYPQRRLVFVDGWTGKGGVASELRRLGAGPLAVLCDPWALADFRGTCDDILSPSACFTGPTTLGFSRTFTRSPQQPFAAYRFPETLLRESLVQAWTRSCPRAVGDTKTIGSQHCAAARPIQHATTLRVHSNEVCRALINSAPQEILFADSPAAARQRYGRLLELADLQNVPQRFGVGDLARLDARVACSLNLC